MIIHIISLLWSAAAVILIYAGSWNFLGSHHNKSGDLICFIPYMAPGVWLPRARLRRSIPQPTIKYYQKFLCFSKHRGMRPSSSAGMLASSSACRRWSSRSTKEGPRGLRPRGCGRSVAARLTVRALGGGRVPAVCHRCGHIQTGTWRRMIE